MTLPSYYFSGDFKQYEQMFGKYDSTVKQFAAKSIMSAQGEAFSTNFYILEGMVKAAIGHEEGQEKTLTFHGQGTVFPFCFTEYSYQLEHSMVVSAVTDVKAIAFSNKTARTMMNEIPGIAIKVAENFYGQINLLNYNSVSQSFDDSRTRICDFLYLYLSKNTIKGNNIQLTQEEIASIVGLRRVQVARVFRGLREADVIMTGRNSLLVKDLDKLLHLCSREINPLLNI